MPTSSKQLSTVAFLLSVWSLSCSSEYQPSSLRTLRTFMFSFFLLDLSADPGYTSSIFVRGPFSLNIHFYRKITCFGLKQDQGLENSSRRTPLPKLPCSTPPTRSPAPPPGVNGHPCPLLVRLLPPALTLVS